MTIRNLSALILLSSAIIFSNSASAKTFYAGKKSFNPRKMTFYKKHQLAKNELNFIVKKQFKNVGSIKTKTLAKQSHLLSKHPSLTIGLVGRQRIGKQVHAYSANTRLDIKRVSVKSSFLGRLKTKLLSRLTSKSSEALYKKSRKMKFYTGEGLAKKELLKSLKKQFKGKEPIVLVSADAKKPSYAVKNPSILVSAIGEQNSFGVVNGTIVSKEIRINNQTYKTTRLNKAKFLKAISKIWTE